MQTAFIIIGGVALLLAAFALMPPLPPIPPELIEFNEKIETVLSSGVDILRYVLTPTLTFIVFTVAIAIFVAEPAYHGVMWILRKIPALGIK